MNNSWICVKDMLPQPYRDVLFFDELGIGFGYLDSKNQWFWFSGIGRIPAKNVTHWMVLPMQPNSKDRNGNNN